MRQTRAMVWMVGWALMALFFLVQGTRAQVPDLPFEPGRGNLHIGPVRVHPFLSVGELYDDNVFLQPADTRDDFITVISPGTVLDVPIRRHHIGLGYRADILEFARLSQEDTVRHTGKVEMNGSYPGGLSWFAQDQARRTNERANTEQDPLIERTQNDAAVGFEYAFADRWAWGVNYLNTIYDYDNQPPLPDATLRNYGTELNRMEQLISTDLYYLIQPKTALLLEYGYGAADYFNSDTADQRNNSSQFVQVGVRGRLTAKMTALVKVGYQRKDFDSSSVSNYDGVVTSGILTYRLRDRTQITLLVDRRTEEATYLSQGDDFYVATSGTIRVEQVIGNKLRAFASGTIANNDYQTSTRNDDIYAGSLGLRYQIQDYLSVSAEYLYERRDSRGTPGSDFDYGDNRVFLRATTGL